MVLFVKKAFKLFNAWQDGNTEVDERVGYRFKLCSPTSNNWSFFYINKIVGSLIKLAGNFAKSIAKLTGKL